MANFTLTDISAIAKETITPSVKKIWLSEQPWLDKVIKTDAMKSKRFNAAENKYIIPAEIAYPTNMSGRKEGSTLPGFEKGTRVRMTASLKKMVNRTAVSWEAKSLQGASEAATEDILSVIKSDILRGARDRVNIHLIGNPDSLHGDATYDDLENVATIQGAGSGPGPITCKYHEGTTPVSGYPGSKWLRVGMSVRIGTAAEILAGTADNEVIATVSDDNKTFTVVGTLTWADGDLVCQGDSDGYGDRVLTGLFHHTDSANKLYQGLDRTTYSQIKGNVKSTGTIHAVTEAEWDKAYDAPFDYGAGSNINMIVSNAAMRRAWVNVIKATRQFRPGDAVSGGGTKTTLSDIQPTEDPQMLPGMFFILDTKQFEWLTWAEFEFEDSQGGSIFFNLTSTDLYEVRNRLYANLVCRNSRAQVRYMDLTQG